MRSFTAGMIRLRLWQRNNSPLSALEIASVEQNGVRQSGDINLKDGEQVAGLRIVAKVVELTGAIRGQIKFENGEPSRAARIIVSTRGNVISTGSGFPRPLFDRAFGGGHL